MRPFRLLDHPEVMPYACLCGTQKGPIVDTLIDKHFGRVYLCGFCVKQAATAYGIADGEKMEELLRAADVLVDKDDEIAGLRRVIDDRDVQLVEARDTVARLTVELEDATGREQQVRQKLADVDAQITATFDATRRDDVVAYSGHEIVELHE